MKLTKEIEIKTWGDLLLAADAGDLELTCDKCHELIVNEHGRFPGIILLGNIYAANKDFAHNLGGIVGDNFPHWSDANQPPVEIGDLGKNFKFSWLEIRPNAYHVTCLSEMLMEAFAGYSTPCPHNCGGNMVLCEDKLHYHCDKCGYDPRMEHDCS